jgi:hypothetical protein
VGLRVPEGVDVVELVTDGVADGEELSLGDSVTVLETVVEAEPEGDDEDEPVPVPVTEPVRVGRGLRVTEGLPLSEAVPEEDGEPEPLHEGDGVDVPLREAVRVTDEERDAV